MNGTWAFVITGCLLLAGSAVAQEEKPGKPQDKRKRPLDKKGFDPDQLFQRLDKNNDGYLDRSEIPERLKDRLQNLDLDNDGKISRQELQKGAAKLGPPAAAPDALFRLLDADRDGKLSKEELQNAPRLLQKFDRNKDGMIDLEELRLAFPKGKGGRPGEVITPAAKGERLKDRLKVGDAAPDFTLPLVTGKGEVKLSSFQGKRPVVLIFASYT